MFWKGRWLVGTVIALLAAAIFAALGFWQYGRHHEKQDEVRAARAAYDAPAPALGPGVTPARGVRVEATGTYDGTLEAALAGQDRGDKSGVDVLTPLRLADGSLVVVDRGWIATGAAIPTPPSGVVTVRGEWRQSRPLTAQDTVRELDGRPLLPRVDVDRIRGTAAATFVAGWIQAQSQQPPPGPGDPQLPVPPPPDSVNHMQYAIQWWALALIPLVGWPIVLVRARRRAGATADDTGEETAADIGGSGSEDVPGHRSR